MSGLYLQTHTCRFCEDIILDLSDQPSNDLRTHDFPELTLEHAVEAGRKGCQLLDWVARAFYAEADSEHVANAARFILRIVSHSQLDEAGDRSDLDVCEFSWVGDEDYLGVRLERIMTVCAHQDDAAARFVLTRPVNVSVESITAFRQARGWLENCHTMHQLCRSANNWLPSRLIDLTSSKGNSSLVLINTAATSSRRASSYAALSYCWGRRPNLLTTRASLRKHQNGIAWHEVPSSIQDAVKVCRELGIAYIWVDALCIVQDDPDDLTNSLTQMPQIYSNAFVTIVASRARGARDGFLSPRAPYTSLNAVFKCAYIAPDRTKGSVVLYDSTVPSENPESMMSTLEPTDRRCWTFQERLLSPRLLEYGTMQTRWTCRTAQYVDGFATSETKSSFMELKLGEFSVERWHELVEMYTQRDLTKKTDKLIAIAAIAEIVGRSSNGDYVAGLWKQNLPSALLWEHLDVVERKTRPPTYVAPTWSWASIQTPVTFSLDDWHGAPLQCCVDVIECVTKLTAITLPYGAVTGGFLILRAKLTPILIDDTGETTRWSDAAIGNDEIPAECNLDALLDLSTTTTITVEGVAYLRTFYMEMYFNDGERFNSIGLVLMPSSGDNFQRIGTMIFQYDPGSDDNDFLEVLETFKRRRADSIVQEVRIV